MKLITEAAVHNVRMADSAHLEIRHRLCMTSSRKILQLKKWIIFFFCGKESRVPDKVNI